MLVARELAREYVIAAVNAPGAAEEEVLSAWAARVADLFTAALSRFTRVAVSAKAGQWALGEGAEGCWAVQAQWGGPGLQWRLLLDQAGAEAVLAGLLGYERLSPGHACTALDLALLQLPLRELAARVQAEAEQPPVALEVRAEVSGWRGVETVSHHLTIKVGESVGEAVLQVQWGQWRDHHRSRRADPRVLEVAALQGAPVQLEAVLPGAELTVQQLLELQPGDVVQMGSLDRQAVLAANGVPIAVGKVGAKGERLAVHVQAINTIREDS